MVRTTTTRGPAPRRLEHIDRAGLVPSRGGRPFRPTVKLDRSQVRDQRLNTPVETRAAWDGRQRIGMPPYMFPIPWQRRINPSVRPPIGRRTGPFNPNARLVPGNSVVRASGIKFNAVPRPGDLRSALASLSRGRLPEGSLAAQLGRTIGRSLLGRLRGSPITGPTKMAHLSRAAAGPVSAARLSKPRTTLRPRSGGSARTM